MTTLREDLTEIKVGVATIAEHIKNVDNRLEDGDKRFDDHSKVIRKHETTIVEIKSDCKTMSDILKKYGSNSKFIIVQGVLMLLAIIGFLVKVIWEYVKNHGLPTT